MISRELPCAAGLAVLLTIMLGAGSVAAQTAATGTPPRLDLPIEGVITPEWTQLPTPDQMAEFYPKLASVLSLNGRARIDCLTTALGGLDHCVVESETPAGLGFGDAALALGADFHLKPRLSKGAPIEGDETSVTIVFRMPGDSRDDQVASPPPPPPDGPAPSAKALTLAHALISASGLDIQFSKQVKTLSDQMINQIGPGAAVREPSAAKAQISQAFEEAYTPALPAYIDQLAQQYARTYSVAEMTAVLTFMRSPAGHAWEAHQIDLHNQSGQIWRGLWSGITADARRRFCVKIDCGVQAKPATLSSRP